MIRVKQMLDKMGYVILFVSNMNESINFYKNVLNLPMKSESEKWTEFLYGETVLALEFSEKNKITDKNPKMGIVIGFVISNLDSLCNELKSNGVKFLEGPKEEEFGIHALILDPDGHVISLTQLNQ